jgi:hypothetical protein
MLGAALRAVGAMFGGVERVPDPIVGALSADCAP